MTPDIFMRVAGLSGALAVSLGAYAAHGFKNANEEQKRVIDTALRYHFIHSLALLSVPRLKHPTLARCLWSSGMLLFCGSCYTVAFSDNKAYGRLAPFGGILLILGWMSVALP